MCRLNKHYSEISREKDEEIKKNGALRQDNKNERQSVLGNPCLFSTAWTRISHPYNFISFLTCGQTKTACNVLAQDGDGTSGELKVKKKKNYVSKKMIRRVQRHERECHRRCNYDTLHFIVALILLHSHSVGRPCACM